MHRQRPAVLGVVSTAPGFILGGGAFSVEDLTEVWGEGVASIFASERDQLEAAAFESYDGLRQLARNLQSFSAGWVADYPDEETYFSLFYGPSYDGGANSTGYYNPEFDALYERARVLNDGPRRRDLYRAMARMIEHDMPIAVLYYDVRREMYYDWLGDLQLHVYLKAQPMYYELDGALRAARLAGRIEGTLEDLVATGAWPEPDEE